MWEVLHDEASLNNYFSIRERNYGNQNLKFHSPIANSNLFKSDIFHLGPKLWYPILSDITSQKGFRTFKAGYNSY